MLSDETVVKLTKMISKRFNQEIGQQVALRLVIARDYDNIKDWRKLSLWLAWDLSNTEIKHHNMFKRVGDSETFEDYLASVGISSNNLNERVDARMTIKTLCKKVKGRKLINHVLGKGTLTRQEFGYLRRVMREEVGYEGL